MPYFILFLYFRKTLPWHVGCMPVQTLSSTSGPHSRRRCWVSCLELCHSSPSTSSSRQTGYVTSWIHLRWRPTRNDGCSTGHECNMTMYLLRAMYTLACKNLHKSIRRLYVNCCPHALFIFSWPIVVEIQSDSPPVTIQEGFGSIITMLRYQFCLSAEGTGKLHENQKNTQTRICT